MSNRFIRHCVPLRTIRNIPFNILTSSGHPSGDGLAFLSSLEANIPPPTCVMQEFPHSLNIMEVERVHCTTRGSAYTFSFVTEIVQDGGRLYAYKLLCLPTYYSLGEYVRPFFPILSTLAIMRKRHDWLPCFLL